MFALLALIPLLLRRSRFFGTTLVAPYRWTLFCLMLTNSVDVLAGNAALKPATFVALRYAAAVATFCPIMALLGAKRPQNTAWQFIVLSLWLILVLPVAEMLVLWRGGELDEGPARQWLLVILLLVSLSNYALTRFALAAMLATAGQSLLLAPQLPFGISASDWHFAAGNGLLAGAVGVAWWQTRVAHQDRGWNCVWRDFRNAYGVVWSLRVMDRWNATAKQGGWNTELNWLGFVEANHVALGHSATDLPEKHESAFRTLLRRFVSPTWIDARLE